MSMSDNSTFGKDETLDLIRKKQNKTKNRQVTINKAFPFFSCLSSAVHNSILLFPKDDFNLILDVDKCYFKKRWKRYITEGKILRVRN